MATWLLFLLALCAVHRGTPRFEPLPAAAIFAQAALKDGDQHRNESKAYREYVYEDLASDDYKTALLNALDGQREERYGHLSTKRFEKLRELVAAFSDTLVIEMVLSLPSSTGMNLIYRARARGEASATSVAKAESS